MYEDKEKRNKQVRWHRWRALRKKKTEAGRCQKNDWYLPPSTAKYISVQQRRSTVPSCILYNF